MLMLITLTYCGLIWLIFMKFKLLPWNKTSQGAAILVGVALILGILILLAQGSPQATGGIQVTTRTVNLQAYSTGRVTKIHVKSYQVIEEGDPIVEVDPEPYRYAVAQREAGLAAAISGVEQMKADLDSAKANVSLVRANTKSAEAGVDVAVAHKESAEASLAAARQGLAAAGADVVRNESNVKTAEIQIPRIRDLVAKKVNPQSDLDNAENQLVAAQSGLAAARAAKAQAEDGVRASEAAARAAAAAVEQARRGVTALGDQLLVAQASERKIQALLDATIQGEHTSVREAREQLATARYNLTHTVVSAPADGYVAALGVTEGDILGQGQFGTFVVTEGYFAVATFSQSTVRHIKPGQPAEIAFASRPGEIVEAEVVAVVWAGGEAQMSQSGNLPQVDQLRPARSVTVRFKLSQAEGFVPQMGASGAVAVYTDHGKAFSIIRKIMLRMTSLLYYLG